MARHLFNLKSWLVSRSRSAMLLAVLAIVILVIVGSTIASNQAWRSNHQFEEGLPIQEGEQGVSRITDWKQYVDDDQGFSIQYPENWYYEENPDFQQPHIIPDALEVRVMFSNNPPPFLVPAESTPLDNCRFDVLIANTLSSPLQQLHAEKYRHFGALSSPSSETAVTINGIEGVKRTYLPDERVTQETRTVTVIPGQKALFALFSWKKEHHANTVCEDAFESMLQSFTLLN